MFLYEELDKRMEASGFKKILAVTPDKVFRLPYGEYIYKENDSSANSVRAKAEKIASSVRPLPKPAILVSDTKNLSFSGLTMIRQPIKSEAFHAFMEKLGIDPEK